MTSTQLWLRLYREVVRDPKLRRLEAALRWLWIVILCLTDNHGVVQIAEGIGYTVEELAHEAGIDEISVVAEALEWFQRAEMIRMCEGDVIKVVHWGDRQFKSDSSAERTRQWRERQKREASAGDDVVTSQDPVSDVTVTDQNRTETEQSRTEQGEAAEPPPTPADALIVIPCRTSEKDSTRTVWYLQPKHVEKLQATYPEIDILAVARELKEKIESGARRPYTKRGTYAALAEWTGNAKKWGNHGRKAKDAQVGTDGSATGGFFPGDFQKYGGEPDWQEYEDEVLASGKPAVLNFTDWLAQNGGDN